MQPPRMSLQLLIIFSSTVTLSWGSLPTSSSKFVTNTTSSALFTVSDISLILSSRDLTQISRFSAFGMQFATCCVYFTSVMNWPHVRQISAASEITNTIFLSSNLKNKRKNLV